MERQVVGVTGLAREGDSATGSREIEVESDGEVLVVREFGKERFLRGSAGDNLVVGLEVVDGAEGDGDGRDGGVLQRN